MSLRSTEMITLDMTITKVTEMPITTDGFTWVVTARAEQMPSTWVAIGLSSISGSRNALRFLAENSGSRSAVRVPCATGGVSHGSLLSCRAPHPPARTRLKKGSYKATFVSSRLLTPRPVMVAPLMPST